jgi:hypothetical protein
MTPVVLPSSTTWHAEVIHAHFAQHTLLRGSVLVIQRLQFFLRLSEGCHVLISTRDSSCLFPTSVEIVLTVNPSSVVPSWAFYLRRRQAPHPSDAVGERGSPRTDLMGLWVAMKAWIRLFVHFCLLVVGNYAHVVTHVLKVAGRSGINC